MVIDGDSLHSLCGQVLLFPTEREGEATVVSSYLAMRQACDERPKADTTKNMKLHEEQLEEYGRGFNSRFHDNVGSLA